MTEKAYGFNPSVIDELNRHPGSQRLSTKQFTLLLIGRLGASVLRANYLVNTTVGRQRGMGRHCTSPSAQGCRCAGPLLVGPAVRDPWLMAVVFPE
jgi:hypothetical protein